MKIADDKIGPPGDGLTERTVYIEGSPQRVENAKQMITEAMREAWFLLFLCAVISILFFCFALHVYRHTHRALISNSTFILFGNLVICL